MSSGGLERKKKQQSSGNKVLDLKECYVFVCLLDRLVSSTNFWTLCSCLCKTLKFLVWCSGWMKWLPQAPFVHWAMSLYWSGVGIKCMHNINSYYHSLCRIAEMKTWWHGLSCFCLSVSHLFFSPSPPSNNHISLYLPYLNFPLWLCHCSILLLLAVPL